MKKDSQNIVDETIFISYIARQFIIIVQPVWHKGDI